MATQRTENTNIPTASANGVDRSSLVSVSAQGRSESGKITNAADAQTTVATDTTRVKIMKSPG